MIRTLAIIAAVGFALCVGCLAGAFAIAGGPFSIDDHWRFHHDSWSKEFSGPDDAPASPVTPASPAKPLAHARHRGAPT